MYNSPISQITDINGLTAKLVSIGTVVIYLLVSLALVYIIWSVVQYFIKGKEGDENRRQAGMNILWGIVGLAVIISLWGLVNILVHTFVTNSARPAAPNADFVNTSNSSTNPSSQFPNAPTDCSGGPANC